MIFAIRSKILLAITIISVSHLAPAPAAAETALEQSKTKHLMELYDAGKYAEAKGVAGQILRADRANLSVHYILGNTYTRLGELAPAKQEYLYCQSAAKPGDQIYQYAQKGLQQLDDLARAPAAPASGKQPEVGAHGGAATTDGAAPVLDRYVVERIKRFHDEGAEAIETRKRALDYQIKIVQQQANDDMSAISQVNRQGMLNPFYETDIAKIRQAANDKIVALSEAFEDEKKKITEHFDQEAKKFEETQQAHSLPQKQLSH